MHVYMPGDASAAQAPGTAAQAHEVTLGGAFGSGGSLGSVTCTSATACIPVVTQLPATATAIAICRPPRGLAPVSIAPSSTTEFTMRTPALKL